MSDDVEVAWPLGPMPGWLTMDPDGYEGFLYFKDPKTGGNNCIRVTMGPTYSKQYWHVWHMEYRAPTELIVSPSIHYIGNFHSPNPVTFKLISKREYEALGN